MANGNRGDIARQMAAGPVVPAVGKTIAEQLDTVLAGTTVLREAEIASSIEAAAATATVNPIALLFGEPQFRLPDHEGVFKNDKTGSISRHMAWVTIPFGDSGVMLETRIYANETIKDGMLEQAFSMATPKGIIVDKGNHNAQMGMNMWKYNTVGKWVDWNERIASSSPLAAQQAQQNMRPRHVKRTAVVAPVAPV